MRVGMSEGQEKERECRWRSTGGRGEWIPLVRRKPRDRATDLWCLHREKSLMGTSL